MKGFIHIYSYGPGKNDIAMSLGSHESVVFEDRCYAMGIDEPRYPVPAIPTRTSFGRYWILHQMRYTARVLYWFHGTTGNSGYALSRYNSTNGRDR